MTIKDLKDHNLLLFECISGSKAYGLDTPASDTDIKGVFYSPKNQFFGLEYIAQVNNETNDEVYYELGRFVELLLKNNPSMLELLASPENCILYKHPLMDHLRIDMFLSKLCKDTFAGYAFTQIKKARGYKKKVVNPVESERRNILDFCFVLQGNESVKLTGWLTDNNMDQSYCGLMALDHTKGVYALYYDTAQKLGYKGIMSSDIANEVSLSSIPKSEEPCCYMYFNVEHYSRYCKEYHEYWEWVEKRNDQRYANNKAHGKDYDAKNMMHTIRLLQVAVEILETGTLNVKRQNREQLLAIKAGQYAYDDLLELADDLLQQASLAWETSALPLLPDKEAIEKILIRMREALYLQNKEL